ncbi:MAG: hypothetical protein ACOX41_09000 [Anaerovoracaceae bacterium]|jgi:putative membrane protein
MNSRVELLHQHHFLRRTGGIILAAAVAAVMTMTPVTGSTAGKSIGNASKKDETVYMVTDPDGTPTKTIVSDQLTNKKEYSSLTDKSNLLNIENVKNDKKFENSDGDLTWNAGGRNVYYQGTTSKKAPVETKITYTLNGEEIEPSELGGRDGTVEIRIDYTNSEKANGVYVPFLALSALTFDDDNFTNISVSDGKVIDDGDKSMVVGYAMPGLTESFDLSSKDVDLSDSVTIKAKAKDFSLSTIMTVVSPLQLDDVKLGKDGTIKDLDSAIDKLDTSCQAILKGARQLASGTQSAYRGSVRLDRGAGQLVSGSGSLYSGTASLDQGLGKLQQGAGSLNGGLGTLQSGVSTLAGKYPELVSGAKELKDGASSVAQSAGEVSSGAQSVSNGAAQALQGAKDLQSGISSTLTNASTKLSQANSVLNTIDTSGLSAEDQAKLTNLKTAYNDIQEKIAAQNDSSTAETLSSGAAQLVGNESSGLTSLADGASQLSTGAGKLSTGASQLSEGADSLYSQVGDGSDLANGVKDLRSGTKKLSSGSKSLLKGTKSAKKGSKALKNGAGQLVSGTKTLKNGTSSLVSGEKQLASGSAELAGGVEQYYQQGIKKIVDAYNGNVKKVLSKLDDLQQAGSSYDTFTDLTKGTEGSVKFIYRTDEISGDED